MFPVEILEKMAFYLSPKDFYAFAMADSRLMSKFEKTDIWVVEFPAVISWAETKQPYVAYDKTNFTIKYKGEKYTHADGFMFRLDGNRLIRSDETIELLLENLVVANPTTQKDEQFIISSLQKWKIKSSITHPVSESDSILKCPREERQMWSLIEGEMEGMFR